MAISQYMLGIRPTLDGLLIDPKMPDSINEFKIQRKYLNHTINITAKRGSETAVYIDDEKVEGNLIKYIDRDLDVLVTYR